MSQLAASSSSFAAVVDTLFALRELARTTLLFRLGGQGAVGRATARAMRREPATPAQLQASSVDLWRVHRALQRASRYWPLPVRCLQTALSLQALLDRHGLSSRLRIGVRWEDEELASHAWIEVGAYALDDSSGVEAFSVLPHPSSAGSVQTAFAPEAER